MMLLANMMGLFWSYLSFSNLFLNMSIADETWIDENKADKS